jgi:DNA-binding transcriptional LysR family regulator
LTPEAAQLVASAEVAEQAAEALLKAARGEHLVGKVRLATIDVIASDWVTPKLPEFWRKHPGVQVEILTGVQQLDLSRGEADLAIRQPRPRQGALSATRLGVGTFGLFGTRAMKRSFWPDADTPRPGLPLFVYPESLRFLMSARWFQALLPAATIRLSTNNTHALRAAALSGDGAAVLPRWVGAREGALVDLGGGRDVSRNEMWLVSHPEFRRDPRVRALADFLRTAARGPGGLF